MRNAYETTLDRARIRGREPAKRFSSEVDAETYPRTKDWFRIQSEPIRP